MNDITTEQMDELPIPLPLEKSCQYCENMMRLMIIQKKKLTYYPKCKKHASYKDKRPEPINTKPHNNSCYYKSTPVPFENLYYYDKDGFKFMN